MVKFERPGQKAHWHIDTGNGYALCQTVGSGEIIQAEIAEPQKERICMRCWKKHTKAEGGRKTLRELIEG